MFHRQFGDIKISTSLLQRTYHKEGVRFKTLHRVKKEIDFNNFYYRNLFMIMHQLIEEAKEMKLKIVFLDEAVFTFNTFKTKAWSNRRSSFRVMESAIKVKTNALLAAISAESGLEDYLIHPKSIKAEQFIMFLERLSKNFEGKPFFLFMDNLSVHKTKEAYQTYKRLKIIDIFNVPYSPQFNGIESYFSLVKSEYKKMILQRIIKG